MRIQNRLFTMAVLLRSICAFLLIPKICQLGESTLQATFHRSKEKYLANHVIATKQALSEIECGLYCVKDGSCVSANYKTSGIGKGRCELNNKIIQKTSDADLKTNPEFTHLSMVKKKVPQQNPSNTCTKEKSEVSNKANVKAFSCKELLEKDTSLQNGTYKLESKTSPDYQVYCVMDGTGCGHGGWTLVMKMDGNKTEFGYDSSYWTNKTAFAVEDGLEGLTEKQTKLASYWNTPFRKLCLGMKVANNETKWMAINYEANSLLNVIKDGAFKNTTAGKEEWKSFINDTHWQPNCNKEGFNIESRNLGAFNSYLKIRIGFVTNNQDHCKSCDTGIGFGTGARGCAGVHWDNGEVRDITCGYVGICSYNNNVDIPAFGYILVQ